MEEAKKSFIEHLEELRFRIIVCLVFLCVNTIISYFFAPAIFSWLTYPLKGLVEKLVFLRPTEAFLVRIKVSFLSGVFISSPVFLYQFWSFITPGLRQKERRIFFPFLISSLLLFLGGAGFSYFLVLPLGLKFFLRFATEQMVPMLTVSSYISFLGILLLAFGIVFELPLLIMLLTHLRIISASLLAGKRLYAIVGIFIVAAFLTPPDVITQILLAVPLLILYEISILMAKMVERKRR